MVSFETILGWHQPCRSCACAAIALQAALLQNYEHPLMYKQLIEQAERYLKSLNTGDNIAAQLNCMLADLMASGEANADAACRRLRLSRRTLQRRLKAERTSFQKILQEARADLAVRYLSDMRLKSLDIAMLLGYSNMSSFTTAFKSWYDMPPTEYRQKFLIFP